MLGSSVGKITEEGLGAICRGGGRNLKAKKLSEELFQSVTKKYDMTNYKM